MAPKIKTLQQELDFRTGLFANKKSESVNHLYRCPSLHSEPEAASGPTAALDSKEDPTGPEGPPGE